jgi:hypothetical protein
MHTLLAQQQSAALHPRVVLQPKGDAWQWWTPELISMVTQCPVAGVVEDWPLIYGALELYGIADYNTCRAAIATIAIETAHTFKPVREAFWLDDQLGHERAEQWRANNLRYYPYYGRGHIQLTWADNYRYYGWRIGHPEILDTPDRALLSPISVLVFGVYFLERGVSAAAQREDWAECRRLVQGADAGLDEFIRIVDRLAVFKLDEPYTLSRVLALGYSRIGDPYVWDGEVPGAFDCSGFIKWTYDGRMPSYTDDIARATYETTSPHPGDIVLYQYYDPAQPNATYPHVGLWLNDRETLDARYGYGVGVHPHLLGATLRLSRAPGVVVDTIV